MACDASTLVSDSKCLAHLSRHELLAIWAQLLCSTPPPSEGGILTDPDGQIITTDDGTIILPD